MDYKEKVIALLNSQELSKEQKEKIEKIFPELKESEDERIRKELLAVINDLVLPDEQQSRFVAWLEKQGNPKVDCPQNNQDVNHPYGCIVMEDFNGGEGFYKLNLDYLNKMQVEEVEEMVRTWNKESKTFNENIKNCIGMCLTDASEQRFKDYNTNLKDCLAWLEKQGEQSQKTSIWKHWRDGICGNGEGKLIYLIKNGYDYSLSSCLCFECDYIELSELDNLMLEKQGEQKPIEPKFKVGDVLKKKGKDYTFTVDRIHAGYYFCESAFFPIEEQDKWELVEQKPVEWSEEDEAARKDIIDKLERIRMTHIGSECDICKMEIDWLKSFRPQKQWKPSEEQMEAVEKALSLAKNCGEEYSFDLRKLLEQLKAL